MMIATICRHPYVKERSAMLAPRLRHDWTFDEVFALYQQPFMDLVWQAQEIHRTQFTPNTIQVCSLQNIKVGGCPEDCAWCGQSVHHIQV